MRGSCALVLAVVCLCAVVVTGQPAYSYDEEYGYDAAYYEEFEDPDFDEANYYMDYDYDEGSTDILQWFSDPPDCYVDGSWVTVNGTQACDVTVKGADEFIDKLNSGVDGAYALFSCFNGHPMYRRQDSPDGEGRLLYFDHFYNEWNFVRDEGVMPEEINPKLIGFGGNGDGEERPQFVHFGNWRFNSSLSATHAGGDVWGSVEMAVGCSNEQGVAVHFEGAVIKSQHQSPSQRVSHSHNANDNFYNSHESGTSGGQGHHHVHWVRSAVLMLVSVVAVSGLVVLGVAVWRRIRGGAFSPSHTAVFEPHDIMLTPEQDDHGTYTAPDERTGLIP
uniref:Uncharacterized protein n=1 Tax=Tetraselmis chuii TaxID=63592 RepID=A0A7S1X5Y7_9CHLO|mmetsp:Transcript_31729/g.56787  ORF Transcript_31729/g.56787 Transcript_31729/m.56787 type:complete len:333 (+) Transcript_31729:321-1319(+)